MALGKDLASIRKSQNLTLEDIQNAVKIPLNTLKSIENESIFSDPAFNKTYVRSFVRSYAKVLKIDDQDIVQALDEMEAGIYSGSLISGGEEEGFSGEHADFEDLPLEETESEHVEEERQSISKSSPQKHDSTSDELDSINWADMGRKFTTASKSSRVWVFILLFLILGSLGGTGYFFWDDINSFIASFQQNSEQIAPLPEQEVSPPAAIDTPATSENEQTEPDTQSQSQNENTAARESIELGETLTVAVYAAYGQLEPIRVTSDLNWRTNPFWMEEGEAYNFDFRDTLLVRGQYSRLLLLFNGHVIENPRQNYFSPAFNSIMITRSVLNQPRYLAPPPQQFPLEVGPPDSTTYRIRF